MEIPVPKLKNYVNKYGYDFDKVVSQVRYNYIENYEHYERLIYKTAISSYLGIDPTSDVDAKEFWKRAVDATNPSRKDGVPWKLGQEDMPLKWLKSYAALLAVEGKVLKTALSEFEIMTNLKCSIARTIMFIRLLPPKPRAQVTELPDAKLIPGELAESWKLIRVHPSFQANRNSIMNQHALDSVSEKLRGVCWLDPGKIGELKQSIESQSRESEVPRLFWPFLLFKHATRDRISSRNHKTGNPTEKLWNPESDKFKELWSV